MHTRSQEIIILGAAESGIGAALLAQNKGFSVFVSDFGAIQPAYKHLLQMHQIPFEEMQHTEERILAAQLIIKSPGIPEKAPIIKKIRQKGILIISEIEFAARYTTKPIIAITGTNGKTTTTLLTHHLLKIAGLRTCLAGNVGFSLAKAVIEDDIYDVYVVEVSSFQLDDTYSFRPKVSMLLNITPDHLDRYEYSMQKYAEAKYKIVRQQTTSDYFIYNAEDSNIIIPQETKATLLPISLHQKVTSNAFIDAQNLMIEIGNASFSAPLSSLPLKGKHNFLNMSAAILGAIAMGVSVDSIKEGLASFVNAPHRLEIVTSKRGITFINDSKATNVDAVSYALESFDAPLVWIVGGVDKGNDYNEIIEAVRNNVKAIVCLGKDNTKLLHFFGNQQWKIASTDTIQEAVKQAYSFAEKGDIVLLSPACASFDLFRNYEDRGNQFREACIALEE